jgi:hypothetical protein
MTGGSKKSIGVTPIKISNSLDVNHHSVKEFWGGIFLLIATALAYDLFFLPAFLLFSISTDLASF